MAAKAKGKTARTKMSEKEVDHFITRYAKERDLKGKELDTHLRHVAATRLAALARYAAKPKKKGKGKK